jgi:hypothetical protein
LFLNEADSKYFDVLERALYNGVISGVSLSGDKFFYDNPLESVHNHDRAPWFGCACCPGNITRFMASVPGYIYTTDEHSIFVNLFTAGNASITLGHDTVEVSQQTQYPWGGKVVVSIDRATGKKFGLKIRIPGWAQNQAVPSDLYQFTDQNAEKYSIQINGKETSLELVNGYAILNRNWKNGDRIEIDFPMPARKVAANPTVENDRGKLAYQRGPLVYCFEDKDNHNGWMFDHFISQDEKVESQFEEDLLGGVVTLSVKGNKVSRSGSSKSVEPIVLKAIPYYAWNNRGTSNMLIWMPDQETTAIPKPLPSPIDSAKTVASTDWAPGLNDGFDPKNSGDTDKSYFYWWLRKGTEETVGYEFKEPVIISESSVYWLDMDHYDGNYRVPEQWQLLVQDAKKNWVPVETSENFSTELNRYNTVRFKPVKTSGLRIKARLQKDVSAGISEWKVK